MRRKSTFDDRLESLLDEATPEQLRRIVDLAGFALRRDQRNTPSTHDGGDKDQGRGPAEVGGKTRRRQSPGTTREIPHAPTPGQESETK